MKNEFYWVGIVLDPDCKKDGDDELHDVVNKLMATLEEKQDVCPTRQLPNDAFVFQCDDNNHEVVDSFRGGDGSRIGFGWSVDSLREGISLMTDARQWLEANGIRNRWVSVYLWDTIRTKRKPAELVPPMSLD